MKLDRRIPLSTQILLLLCIITVSAHAQNEQTILLNIGDPAPPLQIKEWLKGGAIQPYKKSFCR